MKQTVNRVLRAGLIHAGRPAKPKPFIVEPIQGLHMPPGWTSGCVQKLLDILEGPNAWWSGANHPASREWLEALFAGSELVGIPIQSIHAF
jgi:hypothetical protein